MKLIALLTLTFLVSCGKPANDSDSPKKPAPVVKTSILNKFTAVDPSTALHGITDLDFTAFELNIPLDVSSQCQGSYGNSGSINGVAEGFAELQGNSQSGTLQYGNLPYVISAGVYDNLCRALSKEGYNYSIEGKILTLCMVNYPYCSDY